MASNLSCIGFAFADAEAFQKSMIDLARDASDRLGCETGDYSIWRSTTGAQIWFHLPLLGTEDNAQDIAGLTPFFEGSSEIAIEVLDRVARPGDNGFEGAFNAQVVDSDEDANGYPITFDAVDFAVHAQADLPLRCIARITGFARHVLAFADDAAFSAPRQGGAGDIGLASRAFIPVGQFLEEGEDGITPPPASTALLTGRIVEHHQLVNEASGQAFHWLKVESLAATLDIVADPDSVEGEIVEGGTVEIGCVLIGRLLAPETNRRADVV